MRNSFDPGKGIAAHRGNMSVCAENTMESFESAIAAGADWLELDIQRSADGFLVVTHDYSTLRVTGKDKVVTKSRLSELRELNFGNYLHPERKLQVPLLSEVLNLISGTGMRMTIQPKGNGLVRDAVALAEAAGVLHQIGFNDINCEYLIEAKLCNEKIPVFWDRLEHTDWETDLHIANDYGFETLMYLNEAITESKVKQMLEQGIVPGVCVVNEVGDMKKYLGWGVKMFYTDFPATLLELI